MSDQRRTYLFQCGVGRSGTTALRRSLGTHSEIYYNGSENNVVHEIAALAFRNCTMRSRKRSMVLSQDKYDAHFRELICKLTWPNEDKLGRPVHMAAINPTVDQLNYLSRLFPSFKVVGLIRNGIEVVSSRMEFPSFATHDFEKHCDIWNRSVAVFHWGQRNGDRFRTIRHEWLCCADAIQRKFGELFDWLSISHSESPVANLLENLTHPTSSKQKIDRDFKRASPEEKQAYFESKRERWRTWSASQRNTFELRCGESMDALGYEIPWLSSAK